MSLSAKLLMDGVIAMVVGMGMVYIFLVIMIALMNLMSKFLAPYSNLLVKQQPAKKKPAAKKAAGAALSAEDKVLAMAAIEAVKLHRGAK